MPQKKNPDAAELIRAKVGRIFGANVALMTVMKGLPLAYSKDMQEDKEQVFDAADNLMLALAAMEGMVRDMSADDRDALEAAAVHGVLDRDGPCGLAGAGAGPAVPRGASRDRKRWWRWPRSQGLRPAGAERWRRCIRCMAISASRGCIRRAGCAQLGRVADELWRDGAGAA
jgi:hypothetical protein